MKKFWESILLMLFLSLSIQARTIHKPSKLQKQESSHATDWIASWENCGGDGAVKRDGTLWQFGEFDGCSGGIVPVDPKTGKPVYKTKYVYHLKGRKIGSGFLGAKIFNAGDHMYAIKSNGTLWSWGLGVGKRPKLMSKGRKWIDIRAMHGDTDCRFDVLAMRRDGSLWVHGYATRHSKRYFSKIGTRSGWSKAYMGCTAIYALRTDGSLWKHSATNIKGKFKKINKKSFCKTDRRACKRLYRIPHKTLLGYDRNQIIRPRSSSPAGRLWINPQVVDG